MHILPANGIIRNNIYPVTICQHMMHAIIIRNNILVLNWYCTKYSLAGCVTRHIILASLNHEER